MSQRLKQLSETSFYRRFSTVPDKLRRTDKEAFSPKLVSIGPFYHHGIRRKAMEDHKWRYLQSFLERTQKQLKECVEVIKNLANRARHCYLEEIDLNDDELIKMVLVDGAFIIELFLLNHFPRWRTENDIIFNKHKEWMISNVRRDTSLMENQLPFFVLDNLFNFAFKSRLQELPSLLELAYHFFGAEMNLKAEGPRTFDSNVKHLLDALRLWHLPDPQDEQGDGWKNVEAIPGASHLRAAGVRFRMSESKCLFHINFSNGFLYIPCLELFPGTESFLRNITAFEHSDHKHDSYFIDYVAFLGNLINTRADAKLLIKKRIINIDNWLGHDETSAKGDEALAKLFNSFGKVSQFWTRNYKFCNVRQNLKAYYRSHWHWLKISMKRISMSKKKLSV
ncbi:hypothetical protein BT93_C0856 [Corymbia citriodora subsp. variegata]|nr:hypothetical protein BT93_C0856 [Corymbia citriodora subsp. variegata]